MSCQQQRQPLPPKPPTRPPHEMSAPNAGSSSSLVSYSQDVDYTRTEGFKQFKTRYNVKKARAARNDPNAVYPSPEMVYQAVKGPGMTERSLDSLSLDDFILASSVSARRRLKRLSLAPYYAATGGKGWCPGPVHCKYITRKWTKYQANTHPKYPKFIQNFPSQFSYNFPSTGNGQYIHSVPDNVTEICPLGKLWECSKFSQIM